MCRMMLHPGKIIIQEKGKENKHLEGSEEMKKGKKNKQELAIYTCATSQ